MNAVVPPVGAGLPAIGLELTVQVACPGLIAGKPACMVGLEGVVGRHAGF